MQLVSLINNHRMVILIDSRSSHNFLDLALMLKKIQVRVINTIKLQVNIVNRAKIQSEGKCTSVSIKVQSNTIITKFDAIPFAGCDIVLGVEWL
jgi:AAA15 family ATPase/GTPase